MRQVLSHTALICALLTHAGQSNASDITGNTFERLFVNDSAMAGTAVRQLPDGGYILTGFVQDIEAGDEDVLVMRTDSLGSELWRKIYGGPGEDNGWDIQMTEDAGFILTGYTSSFGHGGLDVWLLRLDPQGDTLWTRTFGGADNERSWSVCDLEGGGYLIAAQTRSFGHGERDTWLICTDSSGDTLWTAIAGGTQVDRIFSVDQLTDGSVVATGITNSEGQGDMDMLVMRYALSGERLWQRTYGSPAKDIGHGIGATRDGGMIVAGYSNGVGDGDEDLLLMRLNENGDSLWSSTAGRALDDRGMIARELSGGGYVCVGYSRDTLWGRWDGYIVRADDDGEILWKRAFGTPYDEIITSVIETADRGFAMIGRSWRRGGRTPDLYFVKTDSLGRFDPMTGQ